jgi:hypothetical protein
MEEFGTRDSCELPGYIGCATMVVLLALAAENLSEGNALGAIVLTVIGISCFYAGASWVLTELERRERSPNAR